MKQANIKRPLALIVHQSGSDFNGVWILAEGGNGVKHNGMRRSLGFQFASSV